ncbi:GNAT family N-acetyltransferase [uncultured Streptococcus sp.]|uniref:GNAT family N-acetyltransferase n=1 Tax=uncultured Streptococcus sp. TaxID=83427 RepID=UPI0027DCB16E|nr:GNAT family N-acetyltransferase [uncultured Streptococcus sp.]
MIIRPITSDDIDDIDAVVTLENSVWNETNTPAPLPVANPDKITRNLQIGTQMLVAEHEGQLVGVLDYQPRYPFASGSHVVTFGIAVKDGMRGLGVGRQLMAQFLTNAKDEGYKKVVLNVLGSNPKAIAFYEKLGFVQEACLKNEFYLDGRYVDGLNYSLTLEDANAK